MKPTMIEEKDKTQTAAPPRRGGADLAPLGTLLLAKALGLTRAEATQLRDDVRGGLKEHGALGLARLVASEAVDAAKLWLEAGDE